MRALIAVIIMMAVISFADSILDDINHAKRIEMDK